MWPWAMAVVFVAAVTLPHVTSIIRGGRRLNVRLREQTKGAHEAD
jgi:hypothetical protein